MIKKFSRLQHSVYLRRVNKYLYIYIVKSWGKKEKRVGKLFFIGYRVSCPSSNFLGGFATSATSFRVFVANFLERVESWSFVEQMTR